MRKYFSKPNPEKEIAKQRIEKLFIQAQLAFSSDPKLSDRYVEMARKIAMKLKVRIRPELKKRFCKHCYKYLVPSKNCRIRLTDGHMTYYCLSCKKFMRFPYRKKRIAK